MLLKVMSVHWKSWSLLWAYTKVHIANFPLGQKEEFKSMVHFKVTSFSMLHLRTGLDYGEEVHRSVKKF